MRAPTASPAVPLMGGNPVKSEINNLGLRLALTPNRYHDITLDPGLGPPDL